MYRINPPAPALALALVAIAFLLRVYGLSELPPGLAYDEGWNLVDILAMRETGEFPLYFPNNHGREPLFIYLQAAMAAVWGDVAPFPARLTSAFLGTLTVALLYRLARAMFGPSSWAPLTSATVLAFTLSHIVLSRTGLRGISLPPFAIASFLFLWEAHRSGRWRSFLLGGLFLGLTMQTYLAARLVLFVPLVFVLVALARRWSWPVTFWRKSVAAGLVATIVAAPLLLVTLRDPDTALERVRLAAVPIGTIVEENLGPVAAMFLWKGDQNSHHNLPGRPLYAPVFGLLFAVGLVTALIAVLGPLRPHTRFFKAREQAAAMVLSWFAVMLLPTILAGGGANFLRAQGALPASALLSGLGADAVRSYFPATKRSLLVVALGLLLIVEASLSALAYFVDWSRQPNLSKIFDTHVLALADYLRPRLREHSVAVDAAPWNNGAFLYALRGVPSPRPLDLKHVFIEREEALVQPGSEYLLIAYETTSRGYPLPPWLQQGTLLSLGYPDGVVSFRLPTVGIEALGLGFQKLAASDVSFGGIIAPTGMSVPQEQLIPGEPTLIVLRWRVLQTPSADYHLSLRALDAFGRPWAIIDDRMGEGVPALPSTQWRAGDVVYTAHAPKLPPDAPPGRYRLVTSVYSLAPHRRLAIEGPMGPVGELLDVGVAAVETPSPLARQAMRPDIPVEHRWGGIKLFGYSLSKTDLQAGEDVDLHLFWEMEGEVMDGAAVRLSVEDASGNTVTVQEGPPLAGAYPFARWRSGEAFHDIHRLAIPGKATIGRSRITLALVGHDGSALGVPVRLEGPEVRSRPRNLEPPGGLRPLGVEVGRLAVLEGYAASDQLASGPWNVSLAWRVTGDTERSHNVTVQLLDEGGWIVAQHDGPPASGAAPTSSWVAGEVVLDQHQLSLPNLVPGRYTLIVALYDSGSGERLSAGTSDYVILGSWDAGSGR